MWCQSILHVFACVRYDKCHRRVRVHVPVLIPSFRCHQGLFLAYYCTVMSQRRKSAITFPYIILMSSHSNTDPSQPILTHEIWQAAPEVMKLLLGNRITVHLGFRGGSGSQAANSLIWAGIKKSSLCVCFPLAVCGISTTVWARVCFAARRLGILIVLVGIMDRQFSRHAGSLCFLLFCQIDVVPSSDEQQSTLTDYFSFPTTGIAGVKEGIAEAGS